MKLSGCKMHQRALVLATAAAVSAMAALPLYAADQAAGGIEEVVVTAQFREQKLQDTPIAITAVNSEMLEARNQTSLAAVAQQAPSVNLRETGGAFGPGMSARIRGVGQADFDPAFEPGVGIYIDDVYYPSLTGANFDLLDLDRVEIARGPQGVLGGRNSEGGSIKLYTQKPKGDNSGSIRMTYGSRSLLDMRATGDFALVPNTLSLRVSGVSRKQKGYVSRYDYGCLHPTSGIPVNSTMGDCFLGTEGGKDYSAGRAALRWTPNESFEANLSADVTLDNSESAAIVLQAVNPTAGGALFSNTCFPAPAGGTPTCVPYTSTFIPSDPYISYASFTGVRPQNLFGPPNSLAGSTISFSPQTHTKVWGSNLTLDWKLADSLALKSITSYRRFDSRWSEDNDVSPVSGSLGAEHIFNHSFSEELRLNGNFGSLLDYTLGGYYFDQTTTYATHQFLPYAVPGFEFYGNDPVDASSYAAFLNTTWHPFDGFNVNAGVRYTHEEKDYAYSRLPVGGSLVLGLDSLNGYVGSYSGSKVDYRLNLDYRWNDMLMTYASVSTAFKGGGSNARPFGPGQVVPFDKENLTAYEVGIKSDFFDRRVRLNVAGYINKYKDIQLTLLTCPSLIPQAPCAATFNAGDADIKGVEVEAEVHPTDALSIEAAVSTLQFKYTRLAAGPNGENITGLTVGQQAPGTIKLQWSAGIQYDFGLPGGATLTPRFDYAFQGGFNTNAVFADSNRVAGYGLSTARITWKSPEDTWEAALVGSNLFDKVYYLSNFDLLISSGAQYGMIGAPREFSFEVKKKF
jgi:iron complex outermembrane receptor protein